MLLFVQECLDAEKLGISERRVRRFAKGQLNLNFIMDLAKTFIAEAPIICHSKTRPSSKYTQNISETFR